MTDSSIPVQGTGKDLNTKQVETGAGTVENEIVELYDNPERYNVDAWKAPVVSRPHSVYHGLFTFDIPASMWFMYENGTQVYTSTDIVSDGGMGKLQTTASNPNLRLESRECPRYQPNRGHVFSDAGTRPNKTADGERNWGVGTDENRAHFRLKNDGLLYAVIKSGGVETHEELCDVSQVTDALGGAFNVEKNNTYDIKYRWRSAGEYYFFVNLVHVLTFKFLGALDGASIENPALPVFYEAIRNTEDVTIKVGCSDISSQNGSTDKEQYNSVFAENVSVSGPDSPVLATCNPLQINGQTNTRTVTLARVSVKCSKKATFKVWVTRNPSTFTGATFVALGDGSFIETDSPDSVAGAVRATGLTLTNAKVVRPIPVEAAKETQVDNPYRGRIEFPVVRGDYVFITCTGSAATAEAVIEWGEQI